MGVLITTLLKTIPKLSYKFVWLIMMLIFLFSILRVVIIEAFSISSYVLWIFPPISDFMMMLNEDIMLILNKDFLIINIWMVVYLVILTTVLYINFNKSEYI